MRDELCKQPEGDWMLHDARGNAVCRISGEAVQKSLSAAADFHAAADSLAAVLRSSANSSAEFLTRWQASEAESGR